MYTLEKGRPENLAGRLEKEIRVYDFLDRLKIDYERIDHESVMTMEACREIDRILDAMVCKNLFLCNHQKTEFYLLMLPGEKKFQAGNVSKQIGSARLSFAKEEYMEEMLDITPGSVSVLGLMNDRENHVKLLVDRSVLQTEYIGCHPCINTSSLKIRQEDMWNKIVPAMGHTPVFID